MIRLRDSLLALAGLILLAPLFAALALAVAVCDGRPIFFCQRRVGRHGRDFTLYKFRTMRPAAGAEAGAFDAGNAARVTPLGRWLRRTKLDELPQLWNVLRGDMALVGPRPEVRKWVEAYPSRWPYVLSVRPGITDPAAIRFCHEEDLLAAAADPEAEYRAVILPQKLALYEQYVRRRGFWTDLAILWQTLAALCRRGGQRAR